ncbi:MAG: hypothetical protein K0M40_20450 [Prolixibacteraceae bacterium]|nr:hypothetical protein [Prolixibacteraceae bacterium]
MQFEQSHLYHIYNRGNNSQKIFFNRENYLFFLDKIKKNILPHADILAWCLMPSHFHLMVNINNVEVEICEQVSFSHLLIKRRSLNDSISIILRSYTRAIQKQENLTGSLFQNRTKANCLTQMEGISPAWFQSNFGAIINISDPAKEYPQICFDYIHANPVKDGFVKIQEEWEFSSARDYAGLRNGKLINKNRANEFGLVY